jgi:hypothetical protein
MTIAPRLSPDKSFVGLLNIYWLFVEETEGTFLGTHAFIHVLDVPMFALLGVEAASVRWAGSASTPPSG